MMELESYTLDDLPDELFRPLDPPVQVPQTSFVRYTRPSFWFSPLENQDLIKRPNVHKRVIELLRTIPTNNGSSDESREFEKDRSYKHMMHERSRREKQKNTYNALHSLLPPGTKNQKNAILKMAVEHLQELESLKKYLHKRNHELEKNVMSTSGSDDTVETDTFRLRRHTPPSGIDSMIGVLTAMKNMGLKARNIRSEFSNTEFSAVLEIEQKVEAVMVENAVESALKEVERKFICDVTPAKEWLTWEGDI